MNNEDLDHQLGPQTLTALTPLEPIDQGFPAGSAQLHGMINCYAQIPSYHRGSFVKVSLYNEKSDRCGNVSADLRHCILPIPLSSVWFGRQHAHTYLSESENTTICWVSLCVMLHYFPHAFSFLLHSHHWWHSGQPTGDACLPLFIMA